MLIKANQDGNYENQKRKESAFTTISRNRKITDFSVVSNSNTKDKQNSSTLQKNDSLVNFEQANERSIDGEEENQQSLSFLNCALNHISDEEKKKSNKQRLTQLQKNRIALNYVKFRKEVRSRKMTEQESFKAPTTNVPEKKSVEKIIESIVDYSSHQKINDQRISNAFLRTRNAEKKSVAYSSTNPNRTPMQQTRSMLITDCSASNSTPKFPISKRMVNLQQQPYSSQCQRSTFSKNIYSNAKSDYDSAKPNIMSIHELDNNMLNISIQNGCSSSTKSQRIQQYRPSQIVRKAYIGNLSMKPINENSTFICIRDASASPQYGARPSTSISSKAAQHQLRLDKIKKTCQVALLEKCDQTYSNVQNSIVLKIQRKLEKQGGFFQIKPDKHKRLKQQLQNFMNSQQSDEFDHDYHFETPVTAVKSKSEAARKPKVKEFTEYPKSYQLLKTSLAKPPQQLRVFQKNQSYIEEQDNEERLDLLNQMKKNKSKRYAAAPAIDEHIAIDRLDKTLQKIKDFEQNESFNKTSMKEMCSKYKQFNQRRNQRIKNKTLLSYL